ncbi:hypothetical protein BG261_10750 [Floricoccus tropicus]|uniref:Nudix hydrolase domain-containing protein n=1 Tax=Floricoccus tropicus TaxID=1859473 RepID=A0A1E8GNC8_9LACT|nr:8-oxo-dGTP diphosphatase [Floricoccus tropicus]OFI49749.1 hypothetical protein BG261_10750 [Floricoccus tropicus]
MTHTVNYKFWNLIVVLKDEKILLIERNKGDFGGLVPPGGKVEFPETFIDSAIRELKEESGLTAIDIQQHGLSGFINEEKKEQFIFVDYLCTSFSGDLIENGPEGKSAWYPISKIKDLDIKDDIKLRILELLKGNLYEYQMFWDETKNTVGSGFLKSSKYIDKNINHL